MDVRVRLIQHSGLLVCGEWRCYGRGVIPTTVQFRTWRAFCAPRYRDVAAKLSATLHPKSKREFCIFDFQSIGGTICRHWFWLTADDLPATIFCRFFVVNAKMSLTKIKRTLCPLNLILHFCNFGGLLNQNPAKLPHFKASSHLYRIIELGEQTRSRKEFFKIFWKQFRFAPGFSPICEGMI